MNVSILIATYGESHWQTMALERALPSALVQDPLEVLDHHDPEGTVSSTRNQLGMSAAGQWLLFLDADDELAAGFLSAMRRAFERSGTDGGLPRLFTPAVQYVHKGRPAPAKFNDRGQPLSVDNWLVVGTLVRRDLFLRVGGFEDYPHGFEDWSLWYKCEKAGAQIVKVKDAVYIAHVNPQSKHRQRWRDRKWQVDTHNRVAAELAAWTP